jgi:hypothetical protein
VDDAAGVAESVGVGEDESEEDMAGGFVQEESMR